MDPNATLENIRQLYRLVQSSPEDALDFGDELAEAVQNLDEWLTNGGFLPAEWER